MRTRRTALVAVVLGALAVGAFLLRDEAKQEPTVRSPTQHDPQAADSAPASPSLISAPGLGPGAAARPTEPEKRKRWRLRGRVVDGAGKPFGPATLVVRRQGSLDLLPPVHLSPEGVFDVLLAQLPGTYEASTLGGVRLEGTVEADGEEALLVFDPDADEVLLVRIVDPDGKLVPQVTLQVMTSNDGMTYQGTRVSIGGGLHALARDRLGLVTQLTASSPQDADGSPLPLCEQAVHGIARDAPEVTIRLRAAARVQGRVLGPGGKGLPGILVTARHASQSDLPNPGESSITDPRGEFVISGIPAGPATLSASHPQGTWYGVDVAEIEAPQSDVTLRMKRTVALEVLVLGSNREPIKGVELISESVHSGRRLRVAKTDASGTARIWGLHDEETLDVRAVFRDLPGRHLGHPGSQGPIRAQAPGQLTIVLEDGLSLEGAVVDEDGQPVGLAQVCAASPGTGHGSVPRSWATSDAVTGKFVLKGLPAGRIRVWRGWGPGTEPPSSPVEVELPSADLVLVVPTSVEVRGHLRVADPQTWWVSWPGAMGGSMVGIEADGSFRIAHARGPRGAIVARPKDPSDGRVAVLEDVDLADGPFELVPQEGGTIRGRLVGWSSERAHAGYVHVIARRDGLAMRASPLQRDGSFLIKGLPPGSWTLRATSPYGETELDGVATGSTDVLLDLPPLAPQATTASR